MLDLIMAGTSLYNALKSNDRADDASDQQSALTAAEIARNEKIMELYASGSVEMQKAMETVLANAGSFAEISPENFVNLRNYFTSERKQEDLQNENDVYSADNLAREFGASTFDFAPDIDRVAQKFINARMANAGRAVDETMSRGQADLYAKGMDNSTLEVQLRKSAADLKAQAYNQALLDGTNDALTYVKGVQGVSEREQFMDVTERRFGQQLIKDYMGMPTDTALKDFETANNVMNNQSSMYTDYAATMGDIAAAPYKFAADGQTAAGFGNALSSANSMSKRLNDNANDAGGTFGTWYDRVTGYNDRTPVG